MATIIVDTIEIKNLTAQIIPFFVKPRPNSPIYKPAGGQVQLVGHASLEAEDDRFDLAQLQLLRNNKVIQTNNLKRVITTTITGGTGSV